MAVPVGGGKEITVVSGRSCDFIQGLASDGTNVYWTSPSSGLVMKAPIAGGVATTLVSREAPFAIAVAGNSVYWSNMGHPYPTQTQPEPVVSTIEKTAASGQETETLATVPDAGESVWAVAADGTNVYWLAAVKAWWQAGPTTLMQAPAGGGAPLVLASGDMFGASLAVDTTSVYWTEPLPDAGPTAAALLRVPIGGGEPATVASNLGNYPFAIVGKTAYYAAGPSGNVISSVSIDGGSPVVLAVADGEVSDWLLGNGKSLFWLELKGGSDFGIYRLDLK